MTNTPTDHCIGCATTWAHGYMAFVYVEAMDTYVCNECATVNPENWSDQP